MSESNVRITLRQQQDYQFQVDFGEGIPPLLADEPAPLRARPAALCRRVKS